MKILLPIILSTSPAHLTQRQVEDIRLALEKALKKLETKVISKIDIGEGLEYSEKGVWEVQHEFDDEPTFISIPTEDEEENMVSFGNQINPSLRNHLAELIKPILNADTIGRDEK